MWLSEEHIKGLVSVVIPTYNRASFLEEALDSVLRQAYRPIEVLVVDDGSTDDTADVVSAWASDHANDALRLRYIYQENQGAPAARNKGIAASEGEFIQFLDSDDFLIQGKLARAVELMQERAAGLVYGITKKADRVSGSVEAKGSIGRSVEDRSSEIAEYTWHTSGPVYRRSTIRNIGPWLEHLTGSQDWEYCARAKLCSRRPFVFDPHVGSVYRTHAGGGRVSRPSFAFDYTRSTERAYDNIRDLSYQHGKMDQALGSRLIRLYLFRALEYRNNGFQSDARRCLSKALRLPNKGRLPRLLTLFFYYVPNPVLTQCFQTTWHLWQAKIRPLLSAGEG